MSESAAQPQSQPGLWGAFKQTISEFMKDGVFTLSGALAFFAALSFAPLVILIMWAASFFGEERREQIISELSGIVGEGGGDAIDMVIQSGEANPTAGTVAGLISLGVLLFSATTVFAHLQLSLNRIWSVKANPGAGMWNWLRRRILSLGMVIAIAFLLVISLVADMIVNMLVGPIIDHGWVWQILSIAVSLGIFMLLFAVMFKFVPDVDITWRPVWVGAALTAVLFTIGKFLFGLYMEHWGMGSTYGAAGSMIALMVWAYYTSLIVLYGAEVTQVYARRTGNRITPSARAVPLAA